MYGISLLVGIINRSISSGSSLEIFNIAKSPEGDSFRFISVIRSSSFILGIVNIFVGREFLGKKVEFRL